MKAEGPNEAAPTTGASDQLRPLGPAGAAPLLEEAATQRTNGQLQVEGPWGLSAELTVRNGRPLDATSGRLRGPAALYRIFLWSEARYRWLSPDRASSHPIPITIELDPAALITEGLRQRAIWQRMLRDLPPLVARFELDFGPAAKQLAGLPTAAHALCRLCDGRRSLGEVLRDCDHPDLESLSTLGHLIGAGVLVPVAEGHRTRGVRGADEVPAIGGTGDYSPTAHFPSVKRARLAPWGLVLLGLSIGAGIAVLASRGPRNQPPGSDSNATKQHPASAGRRAATQLLIRPVQPGLAAPHAEPSPAAGREADPGPGESAKTDRLAAGCDHARGSNDPGRIRAACDRAVAVGIEPPDLLALLARLELERGAFARAAMRARRAIALDPKLAEAYAYLGFAEAEVGRRREAMAAYRRYLALAPRGSYADDVRAIVRGEGGVKP